MVNKLANRINEEINKYAKYKEGTNNNETTLEYEDINLVIDGKKIKCDIMLNVDFSFDWWIEESTKDEPEYSGIKNLDYNITNLDIACKDATIYTDDKQQEILSENRQYLNDLIEEDIEEKAYEVEKQEE